MKIKKSLKPPPQKRGFWNKKNYNHQPTIWIPGIHLWMGLLLKGTLSIPNHRAPNHQFTICWFIAHLEKMPQPQPSFFYGVFLGKKLGVLLTICEAKKMSLIFPHWIASKPLISSLTLPQWWQWCDSDGCCCMGKKISQGQPPPFGYGGFPKNGGTFKTPQTDHF